MTVSIHTLNVRNSWRKVSTVLQHGSRDIVCSASWSASLPPTSQQALPDGTGVASWKLVLKFPSELDLGTQTAACISYLFGLPAKSSVTTPAGIFFCL